MSFGVLEKDLDEQDLMEFNFGKIWIQNVADILIFKRSLPRKFSNKFPKNQVFGRTNHLRTW